MDRQLSQLLAEVKTCRKKLSDIGRKQTKTKRDIKKLCKKFDKAKLCKCRKKKKGSKKKSWSDEAVSGKITTLSELMHGLDGDQTSGNKPVGADTAQLGIADLSNTMARPRDGGRDDLKLIAGVGPKLEETLNELGVFHFDQIAAWTSNEINWVDDYLQFPGRIVRDNWIEQAKALAKGGRDEYVRVFGKEPR